MKLRCFVVHASADTELLARQIFGVRTDFVYTDRDDPADFRHTVSCQEYDVVVINPRDSSLPRIISLSKQFGYIVTYTTIWQSV